MNVDNDIGVGSYFFASLLDAIRTTLMVGARHDSPSAKPGVSCTPVSRKPLPTSHTGE